MRFLTSIRFGSTYTKTETFNINYIALETIKKHPTKNKNTKHQNISYIKKTHSLNIFFFFNILHHRKSLIHMTDLE